MEKVYKFYKIAATGDFCTVRIDTVSQNNCYYTTDFQLWSSCHSNTF